MIGPLVNCIYSTPGRGRSDMAARMSPTRLVVSAAFLCLVTVRDLDGHYHPRPQSGTTPAASKSSAADKIDWRQRGQDELMATLAVEPRWHSAKNVILFVGDGMGISTLTAARIFKAQQAGNPVPDSTFNWESFPYTGLVKTYSTDYQTTDSSATATAFLCGEKTRYSTVGVNQDVPYQNCSAVAGNELRSIIHQGIDEGKWTGIVTTTRITHATPASAYAHTASRDWEDDADMVAEGADPEQCWDIARQLVDNEINNQIRVILGGGRRHMMANGTMDPEYPDDIDQIGRRLDGRDLIQEWQDKQDQNGARYKYVERKADFDDVDSSSVDYLMGLFEPSHMKYDVDRADETEDMWREPSLAEMVQKALDILKRGPNGYVLLVEGGRIDHAHHDTNAYRALSDTVALEDAVAIAISDTSADDTLIIVTADHSHAFAMGGYHTMETDILGLVSNDWGDPVMADDDKPYLVLGYLNGPGFYDHRTTDGELDTSIQRINLTGMDTTDRDYLQDVGVPYYSETHGGEDVAVYARGPMSHLFVGQHEQSYVAHAAMYAACLGWNKDLCQSPPSVPGCDTGDAAGVAAWPLLYQLVALTLTFVFSLKWF